MSDKDKQSQDNTTKKGTDDGTSGKSESDADKQQLSQLQLAHTHIATELTHTKEENHTLQLQLSEKTHKIEELIAELDGYKKVTGEDKKESDTSIQKLKNEIITIRAEKECEVMAAEEAKQDVEAKKEREIGQLKAQLDGQTEQFAKLKAEMDTLKAQHLATAADLATKAKVAEQSLSESAEAKRKLNAREQELAKVAASLKNESLAKENMKAELEAAADNLQYTHKSKFEAQMAHEKQKLAELEADHEKMEKTLKNKIAAKDKEKNELQGKYQDTKKDMESTQAHLAELKLEREKLSDEVELKATELEAEKRQLQETKDELEKRTEVANKQIAKLRNEIARLHSDLEVAKREAQEAQHNLDTAKRRATQNLTEEMGDLELRLLDLQQKADQVEREKQLQEDLLQQSNQSAEKLMQDVTEAKRALNAKEKELMDTKQALKHESYQLENAKRELEDTEKQLHQQTKDRNEQEKFLREQAEERERFYRAKATDESKKFTAQIAQLKADLKATKINHDDSVKQLKRETRDKEATTSVLKDEIDELKAQLAHANTDLGSEVQAIKSDRELLLSKYKDEKEKAAKLQNELVQQQRESATLKNKLERELSVNNASLKELEQRAANCVDPTAIEDLQDKLALLQAEINSRELELEASQQNVAKLKEKHREEMQEQRRTQNERQMQLEKEKDDIEMRLRDQLSAIEANFARVQNCVEEDEKKLEQLKLEHTENALQLEYKAKEAQNEKDSFKRQLQEALARERERDEENTGADKQRVQQYELEKQQQDKIAELEKAMRDLNLQHMDKIADMERQMKKQNKLQMLKHESATPSMQEDYDQMVQKTKTLQQQLAEAKHVQLQKGQCDLEVEQLKKLLEQERNERASERKAEKKQRQQETRKYEDLIRKERELREDLIQKLGLGDLTTQHQLEIQRLKHEKQDLLSEVELLKDHYEEKVQLVIHQKEEEIANLRNARELHQTELHYLREQLSKAEEDTRRSTYEHDEHLLLFEKEVVQTLKERDKIRQKENSDVMNKTRQEIERLRKLAQDEQIAKLAEKQQHSHDFQSLQKELLAAVQQKEAMEKKLSQELLQAMEDKRLRQEETMRLKQQLEHQRELRIMQSKEISVRQNQLFDQLIGVIKTHGDTAMQYDSVLLQEHQAALQQIQKLQADVQIGKTQRLANEEVHSRQQAILINKIMEVMAQDDQNLTHALLLEQATHMQDLMSEIEKLQKQLSDEKQIREHLESEHVTHEQRLFTNLLNTLRTDDKRERSINSPRAALSVQERDYLYEIEQLKYLLEVERSKDKTFQESTSNDQIATLDNLLRTLQQGVTRLASTSTTSPHSPPHPHNNTSSSIESSILSSPRDPAGPAAKRTPPRKSNSTPNNFAAQFRTLEELEKRVRETRLGAASSKPITHSNTMMSSSSNSPLLHAEHPRTGLNTSTASSKHNDSFSTPSPKKSSSATGVSMGLPPFGPSPTVLSATPVPISPTTSNLYINRNTGSRCSIHSHAGSVVATGPKRDTSPQCRQPSPDQRRAGDTTKWVLNELRLVGYNIQSPRESPIKEPPTNITVPSYTQPPQSTSPALSVNETIATTSNFTIVNPPTPPLFSPQSLWEMGVAAGRGSPPPVPHPAIQDVLAAQHIINLRRLGRTSPLHTRPTTPPPNLPPPPPFFAAFPPRRFGSPPGRRIL